MVIEARMTDESVTVGVIEARKDQMENPIDTIPTAFLQALGNPELDWKYKTVPQVSRKEIWVVTGQTDSINRSIRATAFMNGQGAKLSAEAARSITM